MGRTVTTSGQFSDSSLTGVPPPAALMRSLELARFALCFFVFWDGGAFRRGEMRVVQGESMNRGRDGAPSRNSRSGNRNPAY